MAGTIYVAFKIWIDWALTKKMSGKSIKIHVFPWYKPLLLSNRIAEWKLVVPTPQAKVQMAGTVGVVVRSWVFYALEKIERKTKKNARVSWFWALFIRKWSNEEVSNPNTSCLGSHGCWNWRGFQNLILLNVSEKFEQRTNKKLQFSLFWDLFVSKQWGE